MRCSYDAYDITSYYHDWDRMGWGAITRSSASEGRKSERERKKLGRVQGTLKKKGMN